MRIVAVRTIKFYQFTLSIPIVVPLLVLVVDPLIPPGSFREDLAFVIPSLVFAGAPYLILAIVLGRWMNDKAPRVVRRMSFIVPLIFLGFFEILVLIGLGAGEKTARGALLPSALFFSVCILLVGYGYVLLVEALRLVGTWLKLVQPLS